MAKRDRDTAIWKDTFYRGLPPLYKCFWDFINDDCDNCGVWIVDLKFANLAIGKRIDVVKALDLIGTKVYVFENGQKWFIKTFIPEKLGFRHLNPTHKFQNSILELLSKHNLYISKGYPDTLNTHMGKDMGISMGKDMGREGVQGEFLKIENDFSKPDVQGDRVTYPFKTESFSEAWAKWKSYRWVVHQKTYAMYGEQAALDQLKSFSEEQALKAINTAISGKWFNLYAERGSESKHKVKSFQL